MGRIEITKLTDCSPFRKVAMGTWRTAKDPSVYGLLEIDIAPVESLIDAYSKRHGVKVTLNHVIGKIITNCLKHRPELNGLIRSGRIYLRDHVSLNYLVNVPGEGTGDDVVKKAILASCSVHNSDDMTCAEIAKEMNKKVELVRTGKDPVISKNFKIFKLLPWWTTKYYLRFMMWLIYGLNWNLSWLGIPKDPFGSVMITNIGSLGLDYAWAPLVPYSRVPFVITLCTIQAKPWVVNDEITIRRILPITVTFDHRFIDGVHASQMTSDIKKCFAEPEKYLFDD